MRYVPYALPGVLLWLGYLALPAARGQDVAPSEAPQVIEGVGAIVQRNQAAARSQALRNALRKALEQTVADLLDSFVLVDEREILETHLYAHTSQYIRSYRVLWEYPDTFQKVYRVGLEVDVAAAQVAQTIEALGLVRAEGAGR